MRVLNTQIDICEDSFSLIDDCEFLNEIRICVSRRERVFIILDYFIHSFPRQCVTSTRTERYRI